MTVHTHSPAAESHRDCENMFAEILYTTETSSQNDYIAQELELFAISKKQNKPISSSRQQLTRANSKLICNSSQTLGDHSLRHFNT